MILAQRVPLGAFQPSRKYADNVAALLERFLAETSNYPTVEYAGPGESDCGRIHTPELADYPAWGQHQIEIELDEMLEIDAAIKWSIKALEDGGTRVTAAARPPSLESQPCAEIFHRRTRALLKLINTKLTTAAASKPSTKWWPWVLGGIGVVGVVWVARRRRR